MLVAAHVLQVVVLVGAGLLLGRTLVRRHGLPWAVFGAGVLAFVFARVAAMGFSEILEGLMRNGVVPPPSRQGVPALTLFFGALGTAITLEPIRWFVLKRYLPGYRSHRSGLLVGAGVGAAEAIEAAIFALALLVLALIYKDQTLEQLQARGLEGGLGVKIGLRVVAWWESDPSAAFFNAGEILVRLVMQIGLTAAMMVAVRRRALVWFFIPVLVTLGFDFATNYAAHPSAGLSSAQILGAFVAFLPVAGILIVLARKAAAVDSDGDDAQLETPDPVPAAESSEEGDAPEA